jgi:A118 family predicted phage portal protein
MSVISALLNCNKIYNFSDAFGVKDITTAEMQEAIKLWLTMYFDHKDKELDDCQRLPVLIVNKLVKTAFSEYSASSENTFAQSVLEDIEKTRRAAFQQMLISGECLIKPVPTADGFIFVPIRRDCFVPLSRNERGELASVGTAELTVEGGDYYTLLERRTAGNALTIETKLFRSGDAGTLGTEVPLASLAKYANLQPIMQLPVAGLGLASLKSPLYNTVDGSFDGVSIYAPAADLIARINRNEQQLCSEFELGRARIMVSDDLIKRDGNGNKRVVDDVFTRFDGDPQDFGLTIFSPAFREQSYLARKTEYLRNIESLIGFKRGILSDVESAERTATEITSSDGDYNLTIIDLQSAWTQAVRDLLVICSALGEIYRMNGHSTIDPDEAVFDYGDGVLYNRDKTWNEYVSMVQMGLIKPEIAVAWYFEESCKTPADIENIRAKYMPEIESLTQSGDE